MGDPIPSSAVTPPVILQDGTWDEEGDEEGERRRRCRGRRAGDEEEAGRDEGCHEEGGHEEGGHEEGGHEEEGLRGVSLAFEGVWVLGVAAAAAFVVRARGLGLLPPPS